MRSRPGEVGRWISIPITGAEEMQEGEEAPRQCASKWVSLAGGWDPSENADIREEPKGGEAGAPLEGSHTPWGSRGL